MSPVFRINGTANPDTPDYNAMVAEQVRRLAAAGRRAGRAAAVDLARQLRQLPARTQITRHDCVEGWSAIGKWHGPLLGTMLKAAGISRAARYVVFTCADLYRRHALL